jgi:hypothetical protein
MATRETAAESGGRGGNWGGREGASEPDGEQSWRNPKATRRRREEEEEGEGAKWRERRKSSGERADTGTRIFFPIFFWFAPFVSRCRSCCWMLGFLAVSRDDVVVPYRGATAVGFLVLGYGGSR